MATRSRCATALVRQGRVAFLCHDLHDLPPQQSRALAWQAARGVMVGRVGKEALQAVGALMLLRKLLAPGLVRAMERNAQLPFVARMLRQHADQQHRDQGARALVRLARKQDPVSPTTFEALGRVGSLHAVDLLLSIARSNNKLLQIRVWAMRALGLYPHPRQIPAARALAGDASLKGQAAIVRDEAFSLLEKIDHPKSLEALLSFLSDTNPMVRYRAVEGVLDGFKVRGLAPLLKRLPTSVRYKREDLKDFVEQYIVGLGPAALPALRAALSSKSWIARLVAARTLGRLGTVKDLAPLAPLARDRTRVPGWGKATVGAEASAAAASIKKRLSSRKPGAP